MFCVLAAGIGIGWQLGAHTPEAERVESGAERKILYWYDPMKPDAHFDGPGKSPFMDMDLAPRYADEPVESAVEAAGLGLAPVFRQNLGIRLATVEKGVLENTRTVSGNVLFDEHAVALVQARAGGIVERAYPLAAGDMVRSGAPLVQVRVPEWRAAQGEYLALRAVPELRAAARARLRQLGMEESRIRAVEQRGTPDAVVTFHAPRTGMLAEFDLREGMTIAPGQTLARIRGIETVWVEARVPEAEAAQLTAGDRAEVWPLAFSGQPLEGRISALLPELEQETRTVRVRVRLPNPEGRLRPGMLAQVRLEGKKAEARLLVPSEALIATGKRHVVIVATSEDRYLPVEVTPGQEAGQHTEILAGLREGERIVVSGQFLIDSEASLRGVLARMENPESPRTEAESGAAAQSYQGRGIVRSVTPEEIVLTHEPIPERQWPAMTMPFALAKPDLGSPLAPGQSIRFRFRETESGPVIESLEIISNTR
jgi:Cu(I)/Ag(I) efflux system membrane fusion protein